MFARHHRSPVNGPPPLLTTCMFYSFRGTAISQDELDPGMRSATGRLSVEAVEGLSIVSLTCICRPAGLRSFNGTPTSVPYTRAGDDGLQIEFKPVERKLPLAMELIADRYRNG